MKHPALITDDELDELAEIDFQDTRQPDPDFNNDPHAQFVLGWLLGFKTAAFGPSVPCAEHAEPDRPQLELLP